jgi:hypothetical protein
MLTALTFFIACILPLFAWAADDVPGGYYLKYSVSDRDVTVVAAVTPYDSDPQVKEAFINWFARGFETVLKGKPPLMIEWGINATASAGRKGYDFGMDEAERYLKKEKGSTRTLHVVPIPPL